MSKSYKVVKKTINMGEKKGEVVYTVRPVSYGILTSNEVAKQISEESTATPGDVKAVLDRYAYYVKENLKKGYSIELLGFGTLFLRFITDKAVSEEKDANASLVKTVLPGFRPSFTMVNGNRIYDLIPERISLVKYGDDDTASDGTTSGGDTPATDESTSGGSDQTSGGGTSTPSGDSGTGED